MTLILSIMTNPSNPRRRLAYQQEQEAVAHYLSEALNCVSVTQRLGVPPAAWPNGSARPH